MQQPCNLIPCESLNPRALENINIAVLGYGAQGEAHALNLRDSGCRVTVAQRRPSVRYEAAVEAGFTPVTIAEAIQSAELVICALPDDKLADLYPREIRPHLSAGKTLGFMHGFAIHYRVIVPPPDIDVVLVAPKAQGRGVRNAYLAGGGVFALLAVHQDVTGTGRERALGWAAGIGSHRAGVLETTFANETETDLFGEQAVLCGGLSALIKAGFETLVSAGYPPQLAYFECCHEIKLLADLIHEGGIAAMREKISSTARFGDLTRGPRIVNDAVKQEMRAILNEIRDGRFAREFLEDAGSGGEMMSALLEADRLHLMERVGETLRSLCRKSESSALKPS